MTTEQKLIDAFEAARGYQPSPDLWSRVLHSIEEDRLHRRRVWMVAAGIAGTLLVAVAIAALTSSSGPERFGEPLRFDWRVLEALEVGMLAALIATLGPAIRRFGRGYVGDILPVGTGSRLLALLDVAYYLVFSGYVLLTVEFSAPRSYLLFHSGDQLEEAAVRIGGLLLIMGSLHAATLMAMPLVGLVLNSNRTGAKLPRWVVVGLVIGGGALGLLVAQSVVGLLIAGLGGD